LASIKVTPATVALYVWGTQQFTATGTFTDGSTQNLTTSVTWGSSNTSVVTTSNAWPSQGLATGLAAGTTSISAYHAASGLGSAGSGGSAIATVSSPYVATISIAGAQLTAMAVYETGNKIFVADDNSQSLHVIDGTTDKVIATIPNVGGSVFDIAVNETHGKVYAASAVTNTTGLTSGTGLISVIDANTGQITKQFNPQGGGLSMFHLANDEVHDKIYLAFRTGTGVIDAATDVLTLVAGADAGYPYLTKIGLNTVTNEIFLPHFAKNRLNIINGNTRNVEFFDFASTGASQPLDIAVNENSNKVYVTMISVPGQGPMGILILDRNTGTYKFVGAEDLEPLAFNRTSNRLFTGVQLGYKASIVDGATDQLTYVDLVLDPGTMGGIVGIAVRSATDRAYLASPHLTAILDGATKTLRKISTNTPPFGGVVMSCVAIHQVSGKVYIINYDQTGTIYVLQD
jgi:YVTN family beta-propeller protein